jgi:regulator of nucleoside diphosphate kinase
MRPNIVVSSLDIERLEALFDALPAAEADKHEGLLDELSRAEIVEPPDMPPDVVTMNSRVRFVLGDTPGELDMTLVYPRDLDGSPDKISILTPVGTALLGLKAGESIQWLRQDGTPFEVKVCEIAYQPERAGELHR